MAITHGAYVLSVDGDPYAGQSKQAEERKKQHRRKFKERLEGTLGRFEVVREKAGVRSKGDKGDRRIVEQLMMDFYDKSKITTANSNKAIAGKPRSKNSQELRKILKNIDVCKN